jgi:hypothetical protein
MVRADERPMTKQHDEGRFSIHGNELKGNP